MTSTNNTTTNETCKSAQYSIASLIKKKENFTIRFDHPAQRESGQWSPAMKSNLISDVLQGNPFNPLILAEEITSSGMSITWNLDGKQRTTTVYEFFKDMFKITKSVRRNIIKYQTILKDENGEIVKDEDGNPMAEWREFDIVNKKFSQLPEELKDRFLDYCFDINLYINCTKEDIIYHIARYNDGKPMNKSQKGIIQLGEEYASRCKSIAKMDFFNDCGVYTKKDDNNGALVRAIAETVMLNNFEDDWKKQPEDLCAFVKENATSEMFDDIEETVDRLVDIVDDENEEVNKLFSCKDTFIWLTVFARYIKNDGNDALFGEFLEDFAENSEDVEWIELSISRNTKDKAVIQGKMNFINKKLDEYIDIFTEKTA